MKTIQNFRKGTSAIRSGKVLGMILIAFFSMNPVYSQDTSDTSKSRKLFLGPLLSVDYSWAKLTEINNSNSSLNRDPWGKMALTAGLNFLYQLTPRVSISLGAEYSQKYTANLVFVPGYGYRFFRHNVNYVDIPVEGNYYLIKKRKSLYVLFGMSANMFLYASESTNWVDKSFTYALYEPLLPNDVDRIYVHSGFNAINYQIHIGLGTSIIRKKAKFRMELVCRMGLSSANPPLEYDGNNFSKQKDYNYILLNCSRTYYSCGLAFSYLFGI